MPVIVLYKDKIIPIKVADSVSLELARLTQELLDAKIEVRIVEPVSSYNANPVHIEMRFRDFDEWTDAQLENYHRRIMKAVGSILKKSDIKTDYSFYIIPSKPPRSIWAQDKT